MAEFSATDAAIEGFRLAGRKPGAVAIWSIAQLLFALVGGALMVLLVGADANAVMGPDSAASWDDPSKAMTMAAGALRVGAVSWLLVLPWKAFMMCAVYRAVLQPQESRFGYLRAGADELRMLLLVLIYIALSFVVLVSLVFVALILAGIISGLSGGRTAEAGAVVLVLLAVLAALAVFSWVAVRLSFAGPLTFTQRKLNLFGSWRLTRGHFWGLSGTYLISAVLFFIFGLVGFSLALVIGHFLTGEGIVPLFQAAKQPDFSSLQSYFTTPRLVMTVLQVFYGGLAMAVLTAPPAAAFRMLTEAPEAEPVSDPAPERQPTGPWG